MTPADVEDRLRVYREVVRNSKAWLLPEPGREFRDLLDSELSAARSRALATLPVPVVEHVRCGSRWGDDQRQVVRRARGRCVGCGGALNETTPGCTNCVSRHAMRRLSAERRAA